ncbi:MAG: sugar transferase [Gammaproteobacteria bacterium]
MGKRLFDVSFSVLGLLLLSPLFLLVGLTILVSDGLPVFFRQERVGYRGRSFRMWKFRTMLRNAERLGQPLTVGQDSRITHVGRWLRKHKLDELPQLINVLKGEMSLVGPRPEVPRYVALYSPEQRRVLELVPGITDPASIAFRDEAGLLAGCEDPEQVYVERIMPEKIRLNLAYAARAGVVSDVGVMLGTLGVLWVKPT